MSELMLTAPEFLLTDSDHDDHSVHLLPPLSAAWGRGGEVIEPPAKISKRGDLTGPQL